MVEHEGIANRFLRRALSPARVAANRRNARKSTGPKTKAGKRRAALNGRRLDAAFPDIERKLQARGEDPRDFRRLHRDVAALFPPHEPAAEAAVQLLAMTWWEKARRIRNGVGGGSAPTNDLDGKIEELLVFLVSVQRRRHEPWRTRLVEVLGTGSGPGWGPGSPAEVRRKIERRLFAFGATKAARTYRRPTTEGGPLEEFQSQFGDLLAEMDQKIAASPELRAAFGEGPEEPEGQGEATRSQEA